MHHPLLYLDPGSSSYIIQVIAAAALGGLFYVKTIWYKIKSFFGKPKSKQEDEPTVQP